MIAKLIVHEDSREAAAARLADACREVEVWPVRTNAGFLARCLDHPRFVEGDVDTGFIAAEEAALIETRLSKAGIQGAARVLRFESGASGRDPFSPWESWSEAAGFRANAASALHQTVFINGSRSELVIDNGLAAHRRHFEPAAGTTIYFEAGSAFEVSSGSPKGQMTGTASDGALRAPMPGKIVATPVKAGDAVVKGQPVVVLEAMKMEHALVAPFDGVVATLSVAVGDQVTDGAVLAEVRPAEA